MLRRWLGRVGFACASGSLLAWGVRTGLHTLTLRVEVLFVGLVVVLLQAVVTSLSFTTALGASGLLFLFGWATDRLGPPPVDDAAGTVTAVVPVYRDADALDVSVRSLRRSRYPDLQVRIVCEPGDTASLRRARELATAPGVDWLVNTTVPGSKAGAISHAASNTDGRYLAVFDADESVHPQFVSRAVARLARGADVVQGRTVPRPTGLVETLAYAESVLLSYVARRGVYALTDFRMAASRAVVMERDAFEAVGGYDSTMLTEDVEFAYRCYRHGLDVREVLASPSTIEAAHGWRDWWGQRKRWMRGYVQVLETLLRRVRPLTRYRNSVSVLLCLGTVLGAVLTPTLLAKFAVLLLVGAERWALLPLVTVLLVVATVHAVDRRLGVVEDTTGYWLVVSAVVPLYGFAAIKSVAECLSGDHRGWYRVSKHGDTSGRNER